MKSIISYSYILQPMIIDKEKQKEGIIQDEKVLLYKPYNIFLSSLSKIPLSNTQII